ncbi:hypothetical protein M011DRAFT_462537 [Sporormia fimetaria CBS 119925]|uniref:CENP-V/GFA domain-containing protein n=1 Tax=Sporormia fimetaria CBS 119925 TaxID=1340428 RepID=A0A6A6UX53_9PLEO|nr:hypothetical protein M011DRAFT_462537 [Sporormia fimetaria CBS 119925]
MSANKAYTGSCHCGAIQYQVKLAFPPALNLDELNAGDRVRMYKCNCTVCHKMGLFHVRPKDPATDFIMTSPTSFDDLADYRCNEGKIGWYFCKKCGCRPFGGGGEFEQVDIDVGEWAGKEGVGKTQKVWVSRPKGEWTDTSNGKNEVRPSHYLSINAVTLDSGEGGVDLNEWHEKNWLYYSEYKESSLGTPLVRWEKPYPGGMY